MSKPTHPNCMIAKKGTRILADGCDNCLRSKVYCDAVLDHSFQRCCDSCRHTVPTDRG